MYNAESTLYQVYNPQREEYPDDRRMIRIKLTARARSKLEKFRGDYFASLSRMFDALSDAEIGQLVALLAKLKVTSGIGESSV